VCLHQLSSNTEKGATACAKKKCPLSTYFTIFLYVSMELSLVSIIEELMAANVKETEVTAVGIHRSGDATLYTLKLALTTSTNGGGWVGIVRSRTKPMEQLDIIYINYPYNRPWRVHRVVRRRGSHVFYTVDSHMVFRLSALRADCILRLGRFLILISVRGLINPMAIVRLEGLGKLKTHII
jgi:hypothetical protein